MKKLFMLFAVAILAVSIFILPAYGGELRADLNGDGKVDSDDAVYLLYHVYFPEQYPVHEITDPDHECGTPAPGGKVCVTCGQPLPAEHEHTVVTDPAVKPTCTEAGITEGKHCSVCGEVLTAQVTVPAAHTPDRTADCENDSVCTVCGELLKAKSGHNFVNGICSNCGISESNAYSVGLEYTLVNNAYYSVTGIGSCTDTVIKIPPTYEGKAVKEIGGRAFSYNITSVAIPDSVTSIGYEAFYRCSNLKTVSFGENSRLTSIGNSAFYGCSSLTSIDIPDGVTSIYGSTFEGCSSLTSIDIPDGVTGIGSYAFSGCSSLASIDIPDGVTVIGGAYAIAGNVFSECSSLKTVTFGKNSKLTTIRDSSFSGCSSLTSIDIPAGVTSIGNSAFYNCSDLTSIDIPDGVTSISSETFSGCSSLTSIDIPDGVTSIGISAFRNCSSLTGIDIPDGVKSISNNTFAGCEKLASVTIPDGVTSIGDEAFMGCSSLTSIDLPEGLKTIGNNAFSYTGLTSVTVPATVQSLGDYTFAECSSLKEATIGAAMIGQYAFDNCVKLEKVTLSDTVAKIDDHAFNWCSSLGSVTFSDPDGWWYSSGKDATSGTSISAADLSDTAKAVECLRATYLSNFLRNTKYSIGLSYTPSEDGSYYIVSGIGSCTDIEIKIRSQVDGKPVKEIGYEAFRSKSSITSVIIPDSITSIGNYAFYNCDSLTSINIPANVTSIGSYAFSNCDGLTSINIPANVTYIGFYAFRYCDNLTSVTFADPNGWWYSSNKDATSGTSFSSEDLSDTSKAAQYLRDTYDWSYWHKS